MSEPGCVPWGHGIEVVDAAGGVPGGLHAASRHHRRERGPAVSRRNSGPASRTSSGSWTPTRWRSRRCCSRRVRSPTCSGRKRVFVAGLLLFVTASLLCGLAGSPTMLNVSRGLQGIGGAMMFATSLALIAQEFAPQRARYRVRHLGCHHRLRSGGRTAGGRRAHRRARLGVDLPGERSDRPRDRGDHRRPRARVRADPSARIDWAGVLTFSAGLFCLVFALIRGNDDGWTSAQILILLTAAVVLFAVFAAVELRRSSPCSTSTCSASPPSPAPRSSRSACTRRCSRCSSTSPSTCRTCSATRRSRPACASSRSRCCPSSPRRSRASSPSASPCAPSSAGAVCVGVGLLLMSGIDPSDDWTTLLAGFVVGGVGIGLINPPLATAAIGVVKLAPGRRRLRHQQHVPPGGHSGGHRRPRRAAPVEGERQDRRRPRARPAAASARWSHISEAVSSGGASAAARGVPAPVRGVVEQAARRAYIEGLNEILVVAAVVAFVGAALALLLVRRRDFVTVPAEAAA